MLASSGLTSSSQLPVAEAYKNFLENIKAENIAIPISQIVTVAPQTTIANALNLMTFHGVSSLPVSDPKTMMFCGSVDMLDLLTFVLALYTEKQTLRLIGINDVQDIQQRFSEPVMDVINASKLNPYIPVEASDSIAALINGPFRQQEHRVPVVKNGALIGLISQMDILQFFYNYYTHFQWLFDKSLGELLHLEDKTPVVSIKGSQPLVHAFHILLDKNITGLAVVDDNTGKILGNVSASDIKGINSNNFFKLNDPADGLIQDSFFRIPPLLCKMQDTLYNVVDKLLLDRVHRLYVVDEELKPLFAVTLSTIIRIFARSFHTDQKPHLAEI